MELVTGIDKKSDDTNPSFWEYSIFVSLSIVLIVLIGNFVFSLVPERSEFVGAEKVADETYKLYSHRLDLISKKYEKELEAVEKDN